MTYNATPLNIKMHLRELDREAEILSRVKRTSEYNCTFKQGDLHNDRDWRAKLADLFLALRDAN